MKKRVMVTVLRTLNDIPRSEAIEVLKALGDTRATIMPTHFGFKIGYMAWVSPEQNYEPVPIHKPQPVEVVDSPEGGFAFQVTTDPQGYEPNHGNVVSFEELLAS